LSGATGALPALAAGLLFGASFSFPHLALLAWIAPGFGLLAAYPGGNAKGLCYGAVAGLISSLVSLRWVLLMPFGWGSLWAWLALSVYLGVFFVLWTWLCWRFGNYLGTGAPRAGSTLSVVECIDSWTGRQRAQWALACAVVWVALEMVRARLFTGFPGNFLGVTQYEVLPLIQISSVMGVYGVSFLVAWVSVAIVCTALMFKVSTAAGRKALRELLPPILTSAAVMGFGFLQLSAVPASSSSSELKVALVQPDVRPALTPNKAAVQRDVKGLMELSAKALESKPDLLVWPEGALVGAGGGDIQTLKSFLETRNVWTILCADEPAPDGASDGRQRLYNAALLFAPQCRHAGTYYKRRLVAISEYAPMERWFPFTRRLCPGDLTFVPGAGPGLFRMNGPEAKISVLICCEDLFPHGARECVDEETDFLLNLTNDGWFGQGGCQWQHAANAIFRAVENGVPIVRCTNNGLTCWADRLGRVREVFRDASGSIYGRGFMAARIPKHQPGTTPALTIYHRLGDWFGWLCVGTAALMSVRLGFYPPTKKQGAES
jgi:apolipoprotein N-acyltransferase